MTISDITLNTDFFTDVRAVLVAALITASNTTTSTTYTASVDGVFNDKQLSKPQVIIRPINKDETKDKFSANYGKQLINVQIECTSESPKFVEQCSNQVEYALAINVLSACELVGVSSDYDFFESGGNKFHRKTLVFHYQKE